jgi:hypothetical protein
VLRPIPIQADPEGSVDVAEGGVGAEDELVLREVLDRDEVSAECDGRRLALGPGRGIEPGMIVAACAAGAIASATAKKPLSLGITANPPCP